jgi:phage repressor protein C with HTH and peptisase S24 domain
MKGEKGGPSWPVVQNILQAYPLISLEWLLHGKGDMLFSAEKHSALLPSQKQEATAEEPTLSFGHQQQGAEKVLVLDTQGNTLAPIINFAAAASYLSGYDSQEYFEHLDTLSLPPMLVKGGRHMVFPVVGDSMADTFQAKDYVLCREIPSNDWEEIKPMTVCVIVSKSRGIQLKRLKVRHRDQTIRCKSDNRQHRSFNLDYDDVLEIWRFEWRLTANAENVGEKLYAKVDDLEDRLDDLRVFVEGMVDQEYLQQMLAKQTK